MDEFNVRHYGIKVMVIIALAKIEHLIFQIMSRSGSLNPDYNDPHAKKFASHNLPDGIRDIKLVSFDVTFTTLCNEEPSADDLKN